MPALPLRSIPPASVSSPSPPLSPPSVSPLPSFPCTPRPPAYPQDEREKATYSHLVKSTLGTPLSPFIMPGAEAWDPAVTLGWSNRGISSKKLKQLQDMLLQNTFLTGLQLAGGCGYQTLACFDKRYIDSCREGCAGKWV